MAIAHSKIAKHREKPFEERLNEMRDDEVRFIKKANRFRAINDASYYFTTALIGLVTWGTAWGLGYTLTADKVFTTLYLFQVLFRSRAKCAIGR